MRLKLNILAAVSASVLLSATAQAQQPMATLPQLPPQQPYLPLAPLAQTPGSPFTVYPVRNGIYMIKSPTGNTAVQVGPEGVIVIDPGVQPNAQGLVFEIRRLSDRPIRYIVNTSGDADHVGANAAVGTGSNTAGRRVQAAVAGATAGATIWAHEQTLHRLAGGGDGVGWPSDTYFVAQKDLFFNDEGVSLLHAPAAHTAGDTMVMFRRSDVVVAGDVYTPDRYPVIDLENGGTVQGLLNGLNHILRLTIPQFNQEGGTFVIPGHGRLSDEADVADYRDMVTIVHDRVKDMVGRRMTLEQVKAARPTRDYDGVYGVAAGAVFTEQVYKSLTAKPQTTGRGA